MYILSLIAFLILFATGMHVAYGHKHDLKMEISPSTEYEAIVSRTTTERSITTDTVTATTIETSLQ